MFKQVKTTLVAMLFAMAGNAALAQDAAPVVGTWAMQLDVQGQVFMIDLVIAQTAMGLAGSIGAAEFGVSPIQDVAFDGETLSFKADDTQGGLVNIALKLAEGKLSGNLSSPMGDLPATATKK